MPRWLWFAPLALLVAALALWAFRLGWIAATITETDVINAAALRYLAEAGTDAQATDCVARPSARRGVWIIVSCARSGGVRRDYAVDRLGRFVTVPHPPARPGAPAA